MKVTNFSKNQELFLGDNKVFKELKDDMLMDQIRHLERKLWNSELSKVNERLKTYQTKEEVNAYKAGYKDAVKFLTEYPDEPMCNLDSDMINGLRLDSD